MSDKKYVVPEGMLKAACEHSPYRRRTDPDEGLILPLLTNAVRWLAEELDKSDGCSPALNGTFQDGWIAAWRHFQRMFLAPESEVPEGIKDLMADVGISSILTIRRDTFNNDILEAYRRGQKAGK